MARFRLFATLSDGAGGWYQIFCDGHQHIPVRTHLGMGSWSSRLP